MEKAKFPAVIVSVNEAPKTKSNGKKYIVCLVEFTEGKLSGKKAYASRTIGEDRSPIGVGQLVNCYATIAPGADGKPRPWFDISASVADADEDIMAALA